MPEIHPIPAVTFADRGNEDVSDRIAPPYDVLDADSKAALLKRNEHNVVAVDLPHTPAKTLGPDPVYVAAGERFRDWLKAGVLKRRETPAIFVYQQTYTVAGQQFKRRGLIANIPTQPFGPGENGKGGVFPHEQTFSEAKQDRLKLMKATQAQLSPIFGLYSDPEQEVGALLTQTVESGEASYHGKTNDGVMHEVWVVDDGPTVGAFRAALLARDVFIADGHHRYNTALNLKNELIEAGKDPGRAGECLFVLISMQDPGMIVLPTHRVLGGMQGWSLAKFQELAGEQLSFEPVAGDDVAALEKAVVDHPAKHAFGIYDPAAETPMVVAATRSDDPLAERFADRAEAWRTLDVAILQHLVVEQLCEANFTPGDASVTWKFPHELSVLKQMVDGPDYQVGIVMRATPLDSVRQVSEAGELMPQKSTYFYPKLATGLVINPLD
ncbi:DUF1015 domain-containing protein [Phycisphaerales bacterium AB-hyl4]|uniref:DUF1015 domain-containing protein n=1 Tax=Natronomicrosphaera hydrolytica TaxID=3242702 RepID=A0ABV4U9B0_9BACT